MSTTLPALPQLGSAAAAHDAFPRSFSPLRLPPSSGTFQWQQLPSHIVIRKLSSNDPPTAPSSSSNGAQVSPSIVVIIIVLTIIFFLSAFLHLLIRWLARNPRGRGSNGRSIVTLTALQGQLQQLFHMHDSGIEQALIDALPVFVYKSVMTGLKEGADCAICLCEFQSDDRLRLLPSCSHAFHMGCIDTWLLSHSTCPLCRTALQPECWIGEADGGMVLDSSRRRSSSNSITQLPPLHESAACGDDIHAAPSVRSHSSQLLDDAKSLTGDSGAASMALELQGCGGQSQRSLGSHSTALTEGASSFISFNEELSERASSTLGSGRRLSVKLGKCRFNKQGQHNPVPHQRGASASQSHSKGSYDYILNPMNLELVVPAFPSNRSQAVSSRRLDLLGHRSSASAECVEANALGNCGGVSSPSSEHMSSCWASASFRRLRNAEEKACVPHVREPGSWVSADPNNSSTGTSMRGNVSSSETPSSPEATQKVSMTSGRRLNAVNCKLDEQKTHSKRAVSFRLPGPPAGSMMKASASRRALSENEAFAFWEVISDPISHSVDHMDPSSTPCMDNGSSVHRSSSFAKRTMDWLVGWQKRTVHPHAINPEVELPNV